MQIEFTTWNINTDSRLEEKFARELYPEWRSNARVGMIQKAMPNSDIIHIQETRHYINKYGEEVDSVTPMLDFFKDRGYNSSLQAREPLDYRSLQYITVYKADRFELVENKVFYCTKTPNELKGKPDVSGKTPEEAKLLTDAYLDHNYGEVEEHTILLTHLLDKASLEDIWTINVHIAFALTHRKAVSEMIVKIVKDLGPDAKVIIAGDFNSFDGWGGSEQMQILTSSDLLADVSENLKLPNGESMPGNTTFFAYPFDCITDQKDIKNKLYDSTDKDEVNQVFAQYGRATGGQLDHIVVSNNLHQVGDTVLNVTPQFFPLPDNYTESAVKDYILSHLEGPAFASDHQSLTVKLFYGESENSYPEF